MNSVAAGLREAADMAERAAIVQQHVELREPFGSPAVIGGLVTAAAELRNGAARLTGLPPVPGTESSAARLHVAGWVVCCAVVLLIVPDPSHPVALALALAGSDALIRAIRVAAHAVGGGRAARRLRDAPPSGEDVADLIGGLRGRLAEIGRGLDPVNDDRHLTAGRSIEAAQFWIDHAAGAVSR